MHKTHKEWYFDQQTELRKILDNITELDQYVLLTLLDRTIWDFYYHTYDDKYKLPYVGRA